MSTPIRQSALRFHRAHGVLLTAILAAAAASPGILNGADFDGVQFEGAQTNENAGIFVGSAGDINGDGFDDVIIGAWKADIGGTTDVGRSYVVYGRGTGIDSDFQLDDLLGSDGSEGFAIVGDDAAARLGRAVDGLGDINGDGIDDLIVGALRADPGGRDGAGEAYVLFGRLEGFPARVDVGDLDAGGGAEGFVIAGIDVSDNLGRSVSRAGDVNGDGLHDILVGALNGDTGGDLAGEAYVIFGRDTGYPARIEASDLLAANGGDGSSGVVLNGIDAGDRTGIIAEAGDVNGDGIDDIIVGAWSASPFGQPNAGEAYVLFGRTSGFPAEFELSTLLPQGGGDGSEGFVMTGILPLDRTGLVHGAGDVNHDGFDDVLVGAWRGDPTGAVDAGTVYVVFGSASPAPLLTLDSLFADNGGDGSLGFVLPGSNAFDRLGSVSSAGDVNNDGIDDIVFGSWKGDSTAAGENAGEAFVLFGRNAQFPPLLPLATLRAESGADGSRGAVFVGEDADGRMGRAVSGAGDFDGDGIDDLIIGAWQANGSGGSDSGEAYLIFGREGLFPATIRVALLDDRIDNPIVGACAGQLATLYDDTGLQLPLTTLTVGAYPVLAPDVDNATSSVSVPAGLRVELFASANLAGSSEVYTSDQSSLPGNLDNAISSLIVECVDPFGAPQVINPGDQDNTVGDAVSLAINASDPNGDTLVYSAAGLPPALSIDADTGVISGTVTTPGTYDVTVTVTNTLGSSDSAGFSWLVRDAGGNIPPSINNPGDQQGLLGASVSLAIEASDADGDPLSFTATGLPPGLSIDADTGVISGTLADAGSFAVEVTVSDDAGGTDSASFTWAVNSSLIDENFDIDAGGFAYIDDAFRATNQPAYAAGTFLPAGGFSGGGLAVELGGIDSDDIFGMSGGWQRRFTLGAPQTTSIRFRYKLTLGNNYEDDEFAEVLVSVDGVLYGENGNDYVARITGDGQDGAEDTTGWQTFTLFIPLNAGEHTLVIGGYNNKKTETSESATVLLDDVLVQPDNQPPGIDNPGAQTNLLEDSVNLALSADDPDGDALTFSATGLPPALGIDAVSGLISGTLTEAGVFDVTVTVDDGNGASDSANFAWTVSTSLIDAGFDNDTDGFGYRDDAFRGTNEPAYASGVYLPAGGFSGGGLQVLVGGVDDDDVSDMSGGWGASFDLAAAAAISVSLRYNLTINEDYEDDEFAEVLLSVDGVLYGQGANDYVDRLVGDGNGGGDDSTGWQVFTVDIVLAAGQHSLTIGGYNNDKTTAEESATILLDDVLILPGNELLFAEDFESGSGWVTDPDGSDDADTGAWEIANPDDTFQDDGDGPFQLGNATSGSRTLVTDGEAGSSIGAFDVDSGITSVRSPAIALPSTSAVLTLNYYLAHLDNASGADFLRITVEGQSSSQVVLDVRGTDSERAGSWTVLNADLSAYAGETITLLIEAADESGGSLIEAGVDDVLIRAN